MVSLAEVDGNLLDLTKYQVRELTGSDSDRDRQPTRFVIRHPTNAQPSIQLDENRGHSGKILGGRVRNTIDIGSLSLRTMRPSGKSAHE